MCECINAWLSICSNDLPFVSGIIFNTKKSCNIIKPTNIVKVFTLPKNSVDAEKQNSTIAAMIRYAMAEEGLTE